MPRFFFEVPFFYKIYFHVIRKHRGITPVYFNSETDYYFDGYPRSGNTYFGHLVLNIFPEKNAVHHLHSIATIKIAIKKGLPVFILIRNPQDSISSNYLKFFAGRKQEIPKKINKKLLFHMSRDYLKYYNFVFSNINRIHIIHFDNLINKPSTVIYEASKKLGYQYEINEIEKYVSKFEKTYKGATSKYGSSKPSRIKEIEKTKIKEVMKDIDHLDSCENIYNQIIDKR